MTMGAPHVIGVAARMAEPLPNQLEQFQALKPPSILDMERVHHIGDRLNPAPVVQPHAESPFVVDVRHKLALAQIGESGLRRGSFDAKHDASAAAAPIKSEHQSGTFRRASMHMRIDAQGSMITAHKPQSAFMKIKTGPPHQRAVAKYPHSLCLGAKDLLDPPAYKQALAPARANAQGRRPCLG